MPLAKRRRTSVGSASVSADTRSALSINHSQSPSITLYSKKESEDGDTQRAMSTKRSSFKAKPLSLKFLSDLICPVLKLSIKSYGHDRTSADAKMLTDLTNVEGTCKQLQTWPGRQGWAEFLGLPAWDAVQWFRNNRTSSIDHFRGDATIMNVASMVQKTQDVLYNGGGYPNIVNNQSGIDSASPPYLDKSKYLDQAFHYVGGYQKHIFQNNSGVKSFLQIWEVTPRERLCSYDNNTSDSENPSLYYHQGPGHYIRLDNTGTHSDAQSNYYRPIHNDNLYNEMEDVGFTYNPQLHDRTSQMWKWSKPIHVELDPGAMFTYTMHFPEFHLDHQGYLQQLIRAADSTDNVGMPDLIPKFTKILVVRYHGQYANGAVAMYDDDDNDNETQFQGKQRTTRYASCTINHLMDEFHEYRAIPHAKKHNVFCQDLRNYESHAQVLDDITDGTGPTQVLNPDSNATTTLVNEMTN